MRRRSLRHPPPMVKAIRAIDLTLEVAYTLYRVNGDTSHDVACAVGYLDRMMEYLTCHLMASEMNQIADSETQHPKNYRSIAELLWEAETHERMGAPRRRRQERTRLRGSPKRCLRPAPSAA